MTHADALLEQVLKLPPDEQERFVLKLAERLESTREDDTEEAWTAEIGRRALALRRGELRTTPAAEVMRRAHERLRRRRG